MAIIETPFNENWYVMKSRLQFFIPLRSSLKFEVDKTGEASLATNVSLDSAFKKVDGYNTIGFPLSSLTTDSRICFNQSSSSILSQALYGDGRSTTIIYWYNASNQTLMPSFMPTNNVIFGESDQYGYTFGIDTHTSLGGLQVSEISAGNKDKLIAHIGGSSDTLLPNGGTPIGGNTAPLEKWAMISYTLDHSLLGEETDNNLKVKIQIRWTETHDGKTISYTFTHDQENMNEGNTKAILDRMNIVTTWYLGGCAIISSAATTRSYQGYLRNFMMYNTKLTDDQLDEIFNNGIDPYKIDKTKGTDCDDDQADVDFWGKYGVLATRSNVKVEKTLIEKETTSSATLTDKGYGGNGVIPSPWISSTTNKIERRYALAARNGSKISVARDDVEDGEVVNVLPSKDDNLSSWTRANELLSMERDLSSLAWKDSSIEGIPNISMKDARSLFGSIINGGSDMQEIDPTTVNNPENLPPGTYITHWLVQNSGDSKNINYPSYLPKYYLLDRLGRTWTTGTFDANPYVMASFWQDNKRYDKIAWTANIAEGTASTGDRPSYFFGWTPVYWQYAIYKISNRDVYRNGYTEVAAGTNAHKQMTHIDLILIDQDSAKMAIYHKDRVISDSATSGTFGEWKFDSFDEQFDSSRLDSQSALHDKIPRIWLPHVVIPEVKIPEFATGNTTATKIDLTQIDESSSISKGISTIMLYWNRTDTANSFFRTARSKSVQVAVPSSFKAVATGWHKFDCCATMIRQSGSMDFNGTITLRIGNQTSSVPMGDFVYSDSKGGGQPVTSHSIVMFLNKNDQVNIAISSSHTTSNRYPQINWITCSLMGLDTSILTALVTDIVTTTGGDSRIASYRTTDANGNWIVLKNVIAKYTTGHKNESAGQERIVKNDNSAAISTSDSPYLLDSEAVTQWPPQ